MLIFRISKIHFTLLWITWYSYFKSFRQTWSLYLDRFIITLLYVHDNHYWFSFSLKKLSVSTLNVFVVMQINMQIKLNVHGCCRPWSGLDDRRFLSLDAEKNSTLQSFFLFRTSVSSLAWKPNSNWVWNSWTGFPREGTLEYQLRTL